MDLLSCVIYRTTGAFENTFMAMWNINELEGRYVGQLSSHSPAAAFCDYMSLYEPRPLEADLHDAAMDDGSHRITYDSREYVLRLSA